MHLLIPHTPYPLPVAAYEPADHPHGEAIRIHRPMVDPQSLGVSPGLECDLEFDDGSIRRIRIGKSWTSQQAGGEVRIGIQELPFEEGKLSVSIT